VGNCDSKCNEKWLFMSGQAKSYKLLALDSPKHGGPKEIDPKMY
jgi:hypothetical protein